MIELVEVITEEPKKSHYTHCFYTMGLIKDRVGLATIDMHYIVDGVKGIFQDIDGDEYEITIKPHRKEK